MPLGDLCNIEDSLTDLDGTRRFAPEVDIPRHPIVYIVYIVLFCFVSSVPA